MESESRRFTNNLAKIFKNKINVSIVPVYKSFKIGGYFQLKSNTPLVICSNIVYKFTCSYNMNLKYYSISTRYLNERVREHLNFNGKHRLAMKDRILSCDICSDVQHDLKPFTLSKKCVSYQNTRSLLIKKDTTQLNHQLNTREAFFLH